MDTVHTFSDKPFTHGNIAGFLRANGYWENDFDPKLYRRSASIDFSFNFRVFVKPGCSRILVANTCYSYRNMDMFEARIIKKIWFSRNEDNAEILMNASDWDGLKHIMGIQL